MKIAGEDAISKMKNPMKEVGLPALEPLEFPVMNIGAGSGPVALDQHFKDIKIYGFSTLKVDEIR